MKIEVTIDLIRNRDGTPKVNANRYVFVDDNNQRIPELAKEPCVVLTGSHGAHFALEYDHLPVLQSLINEAMQALDNHRRKYEDE